MPSDSADELASPAPISPARGRVLSLDTLAEQLDALESLAADDADIEAALQGLRDLVPEDDPLGNISNDVVSNRVAWLPHTLREALPFIGLSRIVSRRLQQGYYRDRLIILITQEKSSSTLHEVAIRKMLRYSGHQKIIMPMPRNLMAGPVSLAGGASFHPGMLYFFPNGGVVRGVFTPSAQNYQIMNETGARRVVLTRHPADRLVAQYCMSFNVYALVDMERGIDIVIKNSLPTNIEWLLGWLERDDKRRTVVRYEDMMVDKMTHFAGIHDYLYGGPMGPELVSDLEAAFSRSGEGGSLRSGNLSTRVYPKGYSGKIGVWRDYMTPRNVETFNTIVDRYIGVNSTAKKMLGLYPDLRLDPSTETQSEPLALGADE